LHDHTTEDSTCTTKRDQAELAAGGAYCDAGISPSLLPTRLSSGLGCVADRCAAVECERMYGGFQPWVSVVALVGPLPLPLLPRRWAPRRARVLDDRARRA